MPEKVTNIKFRTPQRGWLVHPDLRTRMIEEAQEKGTNLGDLAVQILSKHFNIPHTVNGSSRRTTPREDAEQFNFRMPASLERVLGATYPGKELADGIRYVLCAHYGLRVPPKKKMTRRRPAG